MTSDSSTFLEFLMFTNRTLTAATVIVAASMLLYNLARNFRDRVTRASAIVLGCVTVAYAVDSITELEPTFTSLEAWYRVQWVGLAYMPAAMFHLADALLATTGVISRGRRRRMVWILYVFGTVLLVLSAFTDTIISRLTTRPVAYMKPGPLFMVYLLYFVVASFFAMRFVWRARKRCLTRSTRHRMTLLFAAFISPGLGVFPYATFFASFGDSQGFPLLPLTIIFNLANLFVVLMLLFLSYPLSFFGTNKPDRLVKVELLQFLLRGPITAIVLLAVMVSVRRVSLILGLRNEDFMIVASIVVLLSLQWSITLVLPILENRLIYTKDQQQARKLRDISERIVTRADGNQLEEAILAAVCDLLRVPTAFIATIYPDGPLLEQVVGHFPDDSTASTFDSDLQALGPSIPDGLKQFDDMYLWREFWLFPLYDPDETLSGILGTWAREDPPEIDEDEKEMLYALMDRAGQVLADLRVQTRVFANIDELATDIERLRERSAISRFGQIQQATLETSDAFIDWVRGALKDFWGGPRLAESELVRLEVVQQTLDEHNGNPTRALQAVITKAVESLKPASERSMTTAEWILYNILELRYLQGKKVRDVVKQMSMSDADFYRKQKIAIEEVARQISEMERAQLEKNGDSVPELESER